MAVDDLIDRVVQDLPDQMVKPIFRHAADVHPRTLADVVDALDQMQQPRDAFKMLYGVIQEHCSNVVEEEAAFQVDKTTLDLVRKRQVERKEGMLRGVRPG